MRYLTENESLASMQVKNKHCRTKVTTAIACSLICLMITQGCSSGGKVDVTGQVTLDGKPLEDGTIDFVSANGPTAGGIIEHGRYMVPMDEGERRVFIKGFKTIATKYFSGNSGRTYPVKEQIVPKKYNADSSLRIQIDSSHSTHDFALESAKK
jgi:hypothetical protein